MKKLFLALVLAAPLAAYGQAWPAKPIRWVVPYTGGGITDTVTRVVTQKMQTSLGQPIVVDNRPGANSILGADIVAKAPPDGYTMLTVIAAHAANATLYAGKLPFDTVKGFAPISLVGIAPLILTVNNDLPAKDVKQLIAYAKANPGKINFGSSGIGAAAHLTTELLKQTAGIDMVHVPYKGTAPALTALMANDIQLLVDVPSTLMPHVRAARFARSPCSPRRASRARPMCRPSPRPEGRRSSRRPGCCFSHPRARRGGSWTASRPRRRRRSTSPASRSASDRSASSR